MLALGIDTSTKVGYLALVRDDLLLLEETIDAKLDHSARLLPTLQSALDRAGLSRRDLDCVGVGVGPGSLTGVRVGIAFAKGLVFALRKPLVGVCSLEAIAYRQKNRPETISVVVDAKMGGFYCAAYRWDGSDLEEVNPLSVFDREELARRLVPGSVIVSPDEESFPSAIADRLPAGCRLEPVPVFPSAEYVACRAVDEVRSGSFDPKKMVEPIYLRPGVPKKLKPA